MIDFWRNVKQTKKKSIFFQFFSLRLASLRFHTMSLIDAFNEYTRKGFITFGLNLSSRLNKDGQVKKDVKPPIGFPQFTLNTPNRVNPSHNALGFLCGTPNDIIVIDIDNTDHWSKFLEQHGQKEPLTVKQKTANGGVHLLFKFNAELASVKGKDHCFGPDFDIDVRTTGNFIYATPTAFSNSIVNWKYMWAPGQSLFDIDPIEMPTFLKDELLKNHTRGSSAPIAGPSKPAKSKSKSKSKSVATTIGDPEGLKDFIKQHYFHQPNKIGNYKKQSIESNSIAGKTEYQILVPIDEKYCPFEGREHQSNHQYIIIDKFGMRQKCHDGMCKGKSENKIAVHALPKGIQQLVGINPKMLIELSDDESESEEFDPRDSDLDIIDCTENIIAKVKNEREKKIHDVIVRPFDKDRLQPNLKKMILDQYILNYTPGGIIAELTENKYCPTCCQFHDDKGHVSIVVDDRGRKYANCDLNKGRYYPNPVQIIPMTQINVMFDNSTTIINNYNGADALLDVNFEDVVQIFDDNELNKLMFASFKGMAADIADIFFYLGKDIFALESSNDNVWWSWNSTEGIWEKSITEARLFFKNIATLFIQAQMLKN